jgi:hypothetical protein
MFFIVEGGVSVAECADCFAVLCSARWVSVLVGVAHVAEYAWVGGCVDGQGKRGFRRFVGNSLLVLCLCFLVGVGFGLKDPFVLLVRRPLLTSLVFQSFVGGVL